MREVTENYNKQELINMMHENAVYINDHTGREEKLAGLIEFEGEKMRFGTAIDNTPHFSINDCYKNRRDGKLHCSTWSIAGIFVGDISPRNIRKYNESCCGLKRFRIKCIHMPDGTEMYPAAE